MQSRSIPIVWCDRAVMACRSKSLLQTVPLYYRLAPLVIKCTPCALHQRSSLFPSMPSFALLKASDTYSTPCVYHHYIARTLHTLSASLSSARSAPFVASVPTCYLPMLPVAGVPLQLFAVLQKTTQALP